MVISRAHGRHAANWRECGIVVRIESIVLDLLSALLLRRSVCLALPPPENQPNNNQCDRDDRHHDRNRNRAPG